METTYVVFLWHASEELTASHNGGDPLLNVPTTHARVTTELSDADGCSPQTSVLGRSAEELLGHPLALAVAEADR